MADNVHHGVRIVTILGTTRPGPVSVAGVRNVFDEDGACTDEATERRLRRVVDNMIDYIRANTCPRVALEQMVREELAKRAA